MSNYTITESAKLVGVTRQTIHRRIKAGELSVSETTRIGKKEIKLIAEEELQRVFGEQYYQGKAKVEGVSNTSNAVNGVPTSHELPSVQAPNDDYKNNPEYLKERLAEVEKELAETKAEKNKLLSIVENQTLSLPKPEQSKGFFGKLFGK